MASCLDRLKGYFEVEARGSTLRTEVAAGLVNFVANSYQLVLIPQILHNEGKGMDKDRYMFSFVLTTFVSSLLVGVLSNLPIPAGVGVGCTTYFAYALVQKESPWGSYGGSGPDPQLMSRQRFGSTICFVAALFMLLLAVTRISWKVFLLLPASVKQAMPVGLGLLLALGGFQQMGLVVSDRELGELQTFDMSNGRAWFPVGMGLIATALAGKLQHCGWDRTKTLIPMALATLAGWAYDKSSLPDFGRWGSMWGDMARDWFLDFDLMSHWASFIVPCLSLYIICLFDIGGITLGVAGAGGLVEDGNVKGANGVFISCAVGTALAAAMGCPPVIVLGESFAGVSAGGRTGITAIVMGCCFLLSLPLAPLFSAIPLFASAPVLVLLGVELLSLIKFCDMENVLDALPSFCTMALMPYLYSIDRAILAGLAMWLALRCFDVLGKAVCRLAPGGQPEQRQPLHQCAEGVPQEGGRGSLRHRRGVSSLDAWENFNMCRFDASRRRDPPWSFPVGAERERQSEPAAEPPQRPHTWSLQGEQEASSTQLANSFGTRCAGEASA